MTEKYPMHPDILAVIGLDEENSTKGNIAARAYNVTNGGGFEGMNLGWKDMDASTDFLVSVVDGVESVWGEILESTPDDVEWGWDQKQSSGRDFEIADGAVPSYTNETLKAAIELGATEVDDDGLLGDDDRSMERIASVALFELASNMTHELMRLLIEAHDEEEEEDEEEEDEDA